MITACGPLIENGFQNGFSLFSPPHSIFMTNPLSPPTPDCPPPPSVSRFSVPLAFPCRWRYWKDTEREKQGRKEGRRGGGLLVGWWWGREGGERGNGSRSSLSPCHGYDSHTIRLINEIIDHLMGLIINCFCTVSCPIPPPSCCHICFSLFSPLCQTACTNT